uniref:CPG4 domain-containing protein n=1 Tax=Angiostrongylus cantonensis TaxID=6313 RepID=A0A0K0DEI1_ANGCA
MHYIYVCIYLPVINFGFPGTLSDDKDSECLKKCILPLANLERSFHYVFNNYEHVCDTLEAGAYCVQKCSRDDQQKFYQYTTFYRIHCVDYEEDLEPHLPCLRSAAKDSDAVMKKITEICSSNRSHHSLEYHRRKEKRLNVKTLSSQNYNSQKLNIGQIHSIAQTIHPISFERMVQECRNVHDTDHMKKKLLDSSSSSEIHNHTRKKSC